MNKLIYLVGSGGHARAVLNLLEYCNLKVNGIIDKSFTEESNELINGIKVCGGLKLINQESQLILSIGSNRHRQFLFDKYHINIYKKNLIHPRAIVEKYSDLGNANQLFANVIINTNALIGNNNILNTGCIIEHEVDIGSHNHISVGTTICGRSKIGNRCFIGSNSVVIDKLNICDDVTIGAGSVVIKDIVEPGTYVGNPAKKIK